MKTELVAEISGNHLGNLNKCKSLIAEAKKVGATAVKIQTYKAETMTLPIENSNFKISSNNQLWGGMSLYELYKIAHTPWEWHEDLFKFANELEIKIFSTPFDKSAVDLLENLNVSMYKIASLETGDIPLVKYIANTNKPIIASTGASTLDEIDELVDCIFSAGNNKLTLLLCTSGYPTPYEDVNLARMELLRNRYGLPIGLSDHTLGISSSLAAVALGASIIERHFILDRMEGGPDAAFSLEPSELNELALKIEEIELSMGKNEWAIQQSELESRKLRRSLIITRDVKKGEIISEANVKSLRPNIGISPKFFEKVKGKKFNSDYEAGTPFTFENITNN
jgi:pseudaminic acid synthase